MFGCLKKHPEAYQQWRQMQFSSKWGGGTHTDSEQAQVP